MKKIRRYIAMTLIMVITTCSMFSTETTAVSYINSSSDFQNALKKGQTEIYVGDISFEKETEITLNYDVKIIGKTSKSTIKNANFVVVGSNVPGESVDCFLENVVLDGTVKKSDYDFSTSGKIFSDMFGSDRTNKRAFTGTWGYFSLSLDNCEIKNYASYDGPAIYVDNNATFREGKRIITLKNSKIYNNICNNGTVMLFNDNGIYTVDNCLFTNNTAKSGAGAVLSNGTATITNSDFTKNLFYNFANTDEKGNVIYSNDKMTVSSREYNYFHYTGSLFIGAANAQVKNCRITENKGLYGGGVGVTSPQAIVSGEKVEFIDCIISKNSATCGGAAYIKSMSGHNVNFINCNIFGNSAEKGGILYTTTIEPYTNDKSKVNGGNVSFVFCSIAENTDNDGKSFEFYELRMPRFAGNIELLGTVSIDNATYSKTDGYNFVSKRADAINSGAVSEAVLSGIYTNGLKINSSISVPADVYSAWATVYQKSTDTKNIGAVISSNCGYDENRNKPNNDNNSSNSSSQNSNNNSSTSSKSSNQKGKTNKSGITSDTAELSEIDGEEIEDLSEDTDSASSKIISADKKTEKNNKNKFPLWTIIIPLVLIISGGLFALYYFKLRGAPAGETVGETEDTAIDFALIPPEELEGIVATKFEGFGLTKKEIEVAALMLVCDKRKEMAEKLFVSDDTVKTHISHIFKKLGVSSREELRELTKK